MSLCFLSLGSNIGDKLFYIDQALKYLSNLQNFRIISKSAIMRTSPLGVLEQDFFLNQILLVDTKIEPRDLLIKIKNIEKQMGRIDRSRWTEREIDIDILLYQGIIISEPELFIPHKEFLLRLFVLQGCQSLMPDYLVEGIDITINDLYLQNKEALSYQNIEFI